MYVEFGRAFSLVMYLVALTFSLIWIQINLGVIEIIHYENHQKVKILIY